MRNSIIEIENLSCRVGQKTILGGISLRVSRQEFLGVIGPNGAGKTTLIKCILGLINYEGDIKIGSESARAMPRGKMARHLAYLPSEINTIYDYTVAEILSMSRHSLGNIWGDMDARGAAVVSDYAHLAGIDFLMSRKINSLSSGERQMVYLAQALAQESEVLLLDEPTSHLDLNHAAMFFDLLERLNRERGLTIVFVNHDINLAAHYASRLAVMKDGALFCAGAPGEVINEKNLKTVYGSSDGPTGFSVTNELNGRPMVYISKSHMDVR